MPEVWVFKWYSPNCCKRIYSEGVKCELGMKELRTIENGLSIWPTYTTYFVTKDDNKSTTKELHQCSPLIRPCRHLQVTGVSYYNGSIVVLNLKQRLTNINVHKGEARQRTVFPGIQCEAKSKLPLHVQLIFHTRCRI
jgi:hypothetical protein